MLEGAERAQEEIGDRAALVLAGGGARGAYEDGALAELLPALQPKHLPKVVIGTSVGALQAAYFGANAHREPKDAMETAIRLWEEVHPGDVIRPLGHDVLAGLRYAVGLTGLL